MTRKWSDRRDGSTWTVTRVGTAEERSEARAPAGESEEDPPALVFRRGEESFAIPTDYADGLDELEDEQLQGLLDTARGAPPGADGDLRDARDEEGAAPARQGDGQRSPNAAGRESAPHVDPRRHGQTAPKTASK